MSCRENVLSRIYVAVVFRATCAANPLPLGQNIAFEEFSPPVAPDKELAHGTLRLTRARNGKRFAWLVFLRYGC